MKNSFHLTSRRLSQTAAEITNSKHCKPFSSVEGTVSHSTVLAASFRRLLPYFKRLIKVIICLNTEKKTSSKTYSLLLGFRAVPLFSLGNLNVKMFYAALLGQVLF